MLGYTYWHELFSFVIRSVTYRSYLVLGIDYLIILHFSLSCYYCLCCYYTRAFLFTHTLIRSLLTPWIRTSRVLDIFLYCSGVHVIVRFARRLEFLPFDSGILTSYYSCFYTFLDFMYIRFSLYSSSFMWYHAWMLLCDIAVIVASLWFRFISCSDYT